MDEALVERVRSILSSRNDVEEAKLFGGITFKMKGHMVCSVNKRGLVVRVGTEKYDEVLTWPNVKPNMLGTKEMRGMVMVEPAGYQSDEDLAKIINFSADQIEPLDPKVK